MSTPDLGPDNASPSPPPQVVLLPWATRRIDTHQGVYSRQMPALAARALSGAGTAARTIRLFSGRGPRRAHVLLESSPTPESARALAGTPDCWVVTGRWDAEGEDFVAALQVEGPGGTPSERLDLRVRRRELPALPARIAAETARIMGTSATTDAGLSALDVDAFIARLVDADNADLVEEAGVDVLAAPDDLWRWLVRAMRAGDAEAETLLRERIGRWEEAGAIDRAVAALRALAEARRAESVWLEVAELAERSGRRGEALRAAESACAAADATGEAWLLHGTLLVREGRFHEARTPLGEARRRGLPHRAGVWLGVALAACGDVAGAVELWEEVLHGSDEAELVRIARENLERAGVRGADGAGSEPAGGRPGPGGKVAGSGPSGEPPGRAAAVAREKTGPAASVDTKGGGGTGDGGEP